MPTWGFLTNHALVLLCIARDPGVRLRDIAATVGITERSAFGIVSDLAVAGYATAWRPIFRYQSRPTGTSPSATCSPSWGARMPGSLMPGRDPAEAARPSRPVPPQEVNVFWNIIASSPLPV